MEPVSPEQQKQIDLLTDMFRLIRSLLDESERASVILAAARLDVDLERLLKHLLHHHPGGSDPLFDGDRMLGTFSAKIAMAYRLGAVTPDFEHALQMVRRIRNDFAHDLESESLSSTRQKARLAELVRRMEHSEVYVSGWKAFEAMKKSPEHLQFVLCTVCMALSLHNGLTRLTRARVGTPLSLS
jgi:hypothetical protein